MSTHTVRETTTPGEASRANAYKLLSECFHPPDEDLVTLIEDVAHESLPVRIDPVLVEDVRTLRVDHAKLFVGPFELLAPPYESVYVDGADRVMTRTTLAVEGAYREEGLDVGFDEPADHVAAELEFMYYLVGEELEALLDLDFDTATHYLQTQRDFLEEHLNVWIEAFAEDVVEHAETEFYRTVARETARFVAADLEELAENPLLVDE